MIRYYLRWPLAVIRSRWAFRRHQRPPQESVSA